MPDVTPFTASTDTVKGVSPVDVFPSTMMGMSSSASRCFVVGRQINPRPCLDIKLMISGVTFSAATMKSPSFSRFSSSMTISTRPALTSSTASGMVQKWDNISLTPSSKV